MTTTKKNFDQLSKALRDNLYKRKQKMRALSENSKLDTQQNDDKGFQNICSEQANQKDNLNVEKD